LYFKYRIFLKDNDQKEIEFTFYKESKDIHGKEFDKLVPCPLNVADSELLELFKIVFADKSQITTIIVQLNCNI
jgi:hypothetical protein